MKPKLPRTFFLLSFLLLLVLLVGRPVLSPPSPSGLRRAGSRTGLPSCLFLASESTLARSVLASPALAANFGGEAASKANWSVSAVPKENAVELSWQASFSSDPFFYRIFVDAGSGFGEGWNVGDATSYTVGDLDGGREHVFKISAFDREGKEISSVTVRAAALVGQEVLPGDVVINEIAWMGTQASSNDEWLELYNTTNTKIGLSGWTLCSLDGSPEIKLSGSIGAKDYFLLERTDETTVSDIAANLIYTGALSNSGEHLRLADASGKLIDEVDCSSGWFAGNNESKASMERLLPEEEGSSEANWMSNDGSKTFGKDAEGGDILGTPGHENSVYGKEYSKEKSAGDQEEIFEGKISEIKDLELETRVRVRAFITAPPGVFGDDDFYIRDASAGVLVSYMDVSNYHLKLGDEVELEGAIKESREEHYIKMEKGDSLAVLRTGLGPPEADKVKTGELGEDLEGQLVRLSGEIVETSGSTFWIDDSSGRAKIYVKDSTGIEIPYKRVGYRAEVVGIVSQWGKLEDGTPNYRVMPRFQDDLKITKPKETPIAEAAGAALGLAQLPVTGPPQGFLPLLGKVFLCLGSALRLTANHCFAPCRGDSQEVDS